MPSFFATFFVGSEIAKLIGDSGAVAQLVLLVLLGFSFFSWALMYAKWSEFRKAAAQSDRLLRAFRRAQHFTQLGPALAEFRPSPLAVVFEAGYLEATRQVGNPGHGAVQNPGMVQRALQIACMDQVTDLEARLNWLATTGSVTPFIGLFGTVWGIIDAFHGLGVAGVATIQVVAPGISAALVTTAAGLFVAVPAVIGYNHFLNDVRRFGQRLDSFALEFLNAVEKG